MGPNGGEYTGSGYKEMDRVEEKNYDTFVLSLKLEWDF